MLMGFEEVYTKQAVDALVKSGIAEKILQADEYLELHVKNLIPLFRTGKHSENVVEKKNPKYFRFLKDYVKIVTGKAYEMYKISEGNVELRKKSMRLDKHAIAAFKLGWETPDLIKYRNPQ